jgi:C4-dicarboxylate-specific signal transduction histidine kinase
MPPLAIRLLLKLDHRRRMFALAIALLLVAAIGTADYLTGYEVRLSVLYLLPIGYAAWACGRSFGLLVAALGTLTFAVSFASSHHYSREIYFIWDCLVMATTFLLFVELLSRLQGALARSDERFARVLDEIYAAVYVTDENDRMLFANRRLVHLIGDGETTPTATEIATRFVPSKPEAELPAASSEVLFTGTEIRDVNSGRWYMLRAGNIPWVDRRVARLKVMTDITDQKLAQALQREHQIALLQTSRQVDLAEAASTLAHELNQPLVAIVGYNAACIRLLESDDIDRDQVRTAMQKCRVQAVRAGEIIHRLRELTRRRSPQLAWCDLNAMIRQMLDWVELDLERAGIRVELALSDALPSVKADRILVEQVIRNLVDNAIDAMRNSAQENRTLRIASALDADGSVRFTVSDRGKGISPEVEKQLYTPFFTTKDDGLGLGLSICRSIAEMHGGRLWHSANDGGGASFHFRIPGGDV